MTQNLWPWANIMCFLFLFLFLFLLGIISLIILYNQPQCYIPATHFFIYTSHILSVDSGPEALSQHNVFFVFCFVLFLLSIITLIILYNQLQCCIPVTHLYIYHTSCQLTQDLQPWANIMWFLFVFFCSVLLSIISLIILYNQPQCCIPATHLSIYTSHILSVDSGPSALSQHNVLFVFVFFCSILLSIISLIILYNQPQCCIPATHVSVYTSHILSVDSGPLALSQHNVYFILFYSIFVY